MLVSTRSGEESEEVVRVPEEAVGVPDCACEPVDKACTAVLVLLLDCVGCMSLLLLAPVVSLLPACELCWPTHSTRRSHSGDLHHGLLLLLLPPYAPLAFAPIALFTSQRWRGTCPRDVLHRNEKVW
jgi:hypothetical protein